MRALAGTLRSASAYPARSQFGEMSQAILLEAEAGDARVWLIERPLAEVAVLEDAIPFEIVLAHHAIPAPGNV